MSDLKQLQSLFQNAVMKEERDFLSHIEPGGKISPERRLYIYQHAYRARLRDVLAEDFPVLHAMLGDEGFIGLCNRYIDAHPSSHPSLRYFGRELENFLTREAPYDSQPVLAEMARFEWTFHDVFDARDGACVTVENVMELPAALWTTLRLAFHPSVRLAAYDWNVAAVWASVQDEADQPEIPEQMPGTSHILQWRHELKSFYRTVDRDEAAVLRIAMGQKAFPEICQTLAGEHGDQAPVRAAELLKTWVVEGLVESLDYMKMPG